VIDLASLLTMAAADDFVREKGQGATSCVAKNESVCFDWIADNIDRFVTPTLQHLLLVGASVAVGFVVALGLALLSHRRRWLIPPFVGITGVIYTIPSLALFLLLLPVTGRGTDTAVIALSLYNVQILFRNMVAGLANVPEAPKDSGRGMGMSERQLLWRVELPLAVPEIIAGLRIATVSTVAIATLAVFAGGGGLGEVIYNDGIQNNVFKTTIVGGSLIAVAMAVGFDGLYVGGQRLITPWRTVRPV
jgi:osmoprotectant transport system permease protein